MASRFIKCVTVGDGAVGKTSLLLSFTSNVFSTDVPFVVGNLIADVVVDGSTVNLGLWDTAGQQDYNRLRPLSYRGADVFILAFSLVSKASYENISKKIFEKISSSVWTPSPGLRGGVLQKSIGATVYIECSALTQKNVKAVFDAAIKVVMQPPKQKKKRKGQKGCSNSV